MEEKSLLEQVKNKESILKELYEKGRREAEIVVEKAQQDAISIVEQAEEAGKRLASAHYQEEMARAKDEAAMIRKQGEQASVDAVGRGRKRIPSAVEFLVRQVEMIE